MAQGDLVSAVILSEGWQLQLEFEGLGFTLDDTLNDDQDQKYHFGDLADYGQPGNVQVTCPDWGYTNGVIGVKQRAIKGTRAYRRVSPNDTEINEQDVGGNLVMIVPLSQSIYVNSKSSGPGNVGSDPTLTLAAGFIDQFSYTSNAVVDFTITNNSTRTYPNIIGQWDWDTLNGGYSLVEDAFKVGFRARHGRGIDSVELSAVGEGSAASNIVSRTTTSFTLAKSGLYHESYQNEIALTNFIQGERILLRAVVYPKIGDATIVIDTDTDADLNNRITGKTTCWMVCNKTGAITENNIAVVDIINGDNGTGVVGTEAAARANPFEQIGVAMNTGARVVLVKNSGKPLIVGGWGTTPDTEYYLTVKADPNDLTPATITRDVVSDDNYRRNLLKYEGLNFEYLGTANAGHLDGEGGDRQLCFLNCNFDTQVQPNVGLGQGSLGCWYIGCTNLNNEDLVGFASIKVAYSVTGCSEIRAASGFGTNSSWTWIANYTADGNQSFFSKNISNPAPDHNNLMCEHNLVLGHVANGTTTAFVNLGEDQQDICILGNVAETKTITSSGPLFWLWGDGNESECSNIILGHNTIAGERGNLFYNDSGSAPAYRREVYILGSALRSFNIKSDNFAAQPDGARVGNHETEYGVNCRDNMYDGSAAANFVGEFIGLNSTFELNGLTSIFGEMGYTSEQSADTTGLGGGDYQPIDGLSILTTRDVFEPIMMIDQRGQPHVGTYGAIQLGSGPPPIPAGQVLMDLQGGADPQNTTPYTGDFSYTICNFVGDTTVASGIATADGINPTLITSAGMTPLEQYWCFVRGIPDEEVRGELLTATEEP